MQPSLSKSNYDYIISGAGCAGISLLLHILQEPELQGKKILLIDSVNKSENDRTWCYWEETSGFLENLVYHKWTSLVFHSNKKTIPLNIAPYKYKMIRSIDLYDYARNVTQKRTKVTWKTATVTDAGNENGLAFVVADGVKYTAQYIFNSVFFEKSKRAFEQDNCYKLLQHFKGWVIETKQPIFNPNEATFMDFRVGQEQGATFVYVLPTSTTKALVEYTFFNETLLDKTAYDTLLKDYLKQYWNLEAFTIVENEYGVIPMTNHRFQSNEGNVINMGTAGGWTKASSGFTFQFIQKKTYALTQALVKEKAPIIKKQFSDYFFDLYDATLLNVLVKRKMSGSDIFYQLFSKQKTKTIFRFLDNETNLMEDLKILSSVPTLTFLPAALSEIYASVKKRLFASRFILF